MSLLLDVFLRKRWAQIDALSDKIWMYSHLSIIEKDRKQHSLNVLFKFEKSLQAQDEMTFCSRLLEIWLRFKPGCWKWQHVYQRCFSQSMAGWKIHKLYIDVFPKIEMFKDSKLPWCFLPEGYNGCWGFSCGFVGGIWFIISAPRKGKKKRPKFVDVKQLLTKRSNRVCFFLVAFCP